MRIIKKDQTTFLAGGFAWLTADQGCPLCPPPPLPRPCWHCRLGHLCLGGLTWALWDIWQCLWSLLTRNPLCTSCSNQKCLQTLPHVLWGTESPLVENECLKALFTDCGEIPSVITLTPPPSMSHIGVQATVVLRSHTYIQCALSLDVCFGPRRKGGCHSIISLCLSLMFLWYCV